MFPPWRLGKAVGWVERRGRVCLFDPLGRRVREVDSLRVLLMCGLSRHVERVRNLIPTHVLIYCFIYCHIDLPMVQSFREYSFTTYSAGIALR